MIKRKQRPFEGVPYIGHFGRKEGIGNKINGGIVNTAALPTVAETKAYGGRIIISAAALVTEFWLQNGLTAPAGSRLVKLRLYNVDPTTGRPTTAISEEVTMTLTASSYVTCKSVLTNKLKFQAPTRCIMMMMFDGAAITGGTMTTLESVDQGWNKGFSEAQDLTVTAASLSYASGLPDDFTTVASPTFTSVSNGLAATVVTLRCDTPLDS